MRHWSNKVQTSYCIYMTPSPPSPRVNLVTSLEQRQEQLTRLLLAFHADPDVVDAQQRTPLHQAALQGVDLGCRSLADAAGAPHFSALRKVVMVWSDQYSWDGLTPKTSENLRKKTRWSSTQIGSTLVVSPKVNRQIQSYG
jgi:ankyrin repeat protein